MVLGNKCDMNDKRQVSKERGEKVWADPCREQDSFDQTEWKQETSRRWCHLIIMHLGADEIFTLCFASGIRLLTVRNAAHWFQPQWDKTRLNLCFKCHFNLFFYPGIIPFSLVFQLAIDFGIKFLETSAKSSINVEEVSPDPDPPSPPSVPRTRGDSFLSRFPSQGFYTLARDIMARLNRKMVSWRSDSSSWLQICKWLHQLNMRGRMCR